MTIKELEGKRKNYLTKYWTYKRVYYKSFKFKVLDNIIYRKNNRKITYNDCIIMADTETSKKTSCDTEENHICLWTLTIRAFNINIVTLYGHKPSEFIDCLIRIRSILKGHRIYIYFHNLAYDWQFLRKYIIKAFQIPKNQLNTKSHYPISIEFENGIILKDSLILAQRSLEKWGKDLNVEHQKAVGYWDYDIIRNQNYYFSDDELHYAEFDTVCGVECIDTLLNQLHKSIDSAPFTATGIPRKEVQEIGKAYGAKERFKNNVVPYDVNLLLLQLFHGGYTHANRHLIDVLIQGNIKCYDFASSYPFVMLSEKFPAECFHVTHAIKTVDDILDHAEQYAFIFNIGFTSCRIKPTIKMPTLQVSKLENSINLIADNGRVLQADFCNLLLNEIDLQVIINQYDYKDVYIKDVYVARKSYLPKWFTNYIFRLFKDKTMLKGGDPVSYALAKSKLNSLYGMCAQKPTRDTLEEDYDTGEYNIKVEDPEELYDKYVNKRNTILPYQWGVWVTSYAFRNLFELGSCCGTWIYSDTDSCYGTDWNIEKLNAYNEKCKNKLKANNYGCVNFNNREYWLGIAELDGEYKEFKTLGAKRYACRDLEGHLKITVAGVPKKTGVKCLNDDINNFSDGLIFAGSITGKLTHKYIYVENEYIDKDGNETGDSVDLSECDYLLDKVRLNNIFEEELSLSYYE